MYYTDMEERRMFPRLHIKIPLQYKNLESSPNTFISSLSENISRKGTAFSCYEFIAPASRIVVVLAIERPRPMQIKAISRIAWIKKNSSPDNYTIGVKFVAMTKEDENALDNFVKSHLVF